MSITAKADGHVASTTPLNTRHRALLFYVLLLTSTPQISSGTQLAAMRSQKGAADWCECLECFTGSEDGNGLQDSYVR